MDALLDLFLIATHIAPWVLKQAEEHERVRAIDTKKRQAERDLADPQKPKELQSGAWPEKRSGLGLGTMTSSTMAKVDGGGKKITIKLKKKN